MAQFTVSIPAPIVALLTRQISRENPDPPPVNEAQFLIDRAVARIVEEWRNQQKQEDSQTFRAQWSLATPAQRSGVRAVLGLGSEDP